MVKIHREHFSVATLGEDRATRILHKNIRRVAFSLPLFLLLIFFFSFFLLSSSLLFSSSSSFILFCYLCFSTIVVHQQLEAFLDPAAASRGLVSHRHVYSLSCENLPMGQRERGNREGRGSRREEGRERRRGKSREKEGEGKENRREVVNRIA